MEAPTMNSPLVKRRGHVRPSVQKRVSFHQDQNYGDDSRFTMRRYHSDVAINQSAISLAKYPTIAERGVPEGQEDPERIVADVRRKSLKLKIFQPAIDKRQFLDWAKKKWENYQMLPRLPLCPTNIVPDDNDMEILPNSPELCQTVAIPVEMDPNELNKVKKETKFSTFKSNNLLINLQSFKCFVNFYSGQPRSSQLVISQSAIYLVSNATTVWKTKLIDLQDVQVNLFDN